MPSILKLPGTTIAGVPIPSLDPRLTDGSLLLVDPTHTATEWSGIAQGGETIPNLAATEAAATVGAPVNAVTLFDTTTDPTHALMELTEAGSLHLTTSVTVDVLNERVGFSIPQSLRAYLYANTTHSYYVGLQVKMTRVANTGQTVGFLGGIFQSPVFGNAAQAAIGVLDSGAMAATPSSSSPDRLGFTTATSSTNGNQIGAVSASTLNLTYDATSYVAAAGPFQGPGVNDSPSFIFRSLYIEDLTVSGRTHAEVSALDLDEFHTASANRWASDTATAIA